MVVPLQAVKKCFRQADTTPCSQILSLLLAQEGGEVIFADAAAEGVWCLAYPCRLQHFGQEHCFKLFRFFVQPCVSVLYQMGYRVRDDHQ
ncbi:hypothetical protein AVJ23_17185 [Pseudoponticoccus marisrubri]|uniref:Uncharacterized protein n=1 Tax=Pseudoponticoccus marisrubri TaxID=1685382 RepID=A0A0W7WGK9_9RHOB|nr:hypothetical protein AVJ23_17185 [Pseudoponticoccus marisrubri]